MISDIQQKVNASSENSLYILTEPLAAFTGAVGDVTFYIRPVEVPEQFNFQYLIHDVQIRWPTSFNFDYSITAAFCGQLAQVGVPILSGNGGLPLSSINYDSVGPDQGNGYEESPLNVSTGVSGFGVKVLGTSHLKTQQNWVSLDLPKIMLNPILKISGVAPALNYDRRALTFYSNVDLLTLLLEEAELRIVYEQIRAK